MPSSVVLRLSGLAAIQAFTCACIARAMACSDSSISSDISICCISISRHLRGRAPFDRSEPHRLAARRMPRSLVERTERLKDLIDRDWRLTA
jgi:hypothetical protein